MAENTPYFDTIVAIRSMRLDAEAALEGMTTMSVETCEELGEADILSYIEGNFTQFLAALRHLSTEDQELLLSYYITGKTQATLAKFFGSTQTLTSTRIRRAIQRLGGFLMLGEPTPDVTAELFLECGVEDKLRVPLSRLVAHYATTRSFLATAQAFGLKRVDVRSAMRLASLNLRDASDIRQKALGAYVFGLIEKSSAFGTGWSDRKKRKQGDVFHQDSGLLGEFTIDVSHPDFEANCFISRAVL